MQKASKDDKKVKKLLKYLRKDRFKKFKSYVDRHGIVLREVRSENGENLLHEACRAGTGYFLRYFLEKGVDPMFANEKGEVPLHVAYQKVLFSGQTGALDDLVRPLLRKCVAAAEVEDQRGRRPTDYMRQFQEKLARDEGEEDDSLSSEEEERFQKKEEKAKEEEEEEMWRRKLMEEMDDEYDQEIGNYDKDFVEPDKEPDTFDNWAESIHRERRAKRERSYFAFEEEIAKKRKKKKKEEEEEPRKKLKEMEEEHRRYQERAKNKHKERLLKLKKRYTERIKEFFAAKEDRGEIGYSDVPWPHFKSERPKADKSKGDKSKGGDSAESMKEFLLCDVDMKDEAAVKKCLKEQQVVWHPDRFSQKCGRYLREEDTERIMGRVNSISQQLNALLTDIT